jgi:radical SAM protein with 4Fe4S-binding SPASM domain
MLSLPHIAFETTDACNLRCVYCYNIWKRDDAVRTPFNSYSKATATLRRLFVQADVGSVALTGGEPFLAERMKELVLFCRMEGKRVTLITNGTRASKGDYRSLLRMGVQLFELPVHSAQPTIHDMMTGMAGSWARSTASLKALLRLGAEVVAVVVLTRHNTPMLSETLDFISSLGIRRVMLNRYNIGGQGCAAPLSVSASANELRQAFAVANSKAASLGLHITSNVCSPVCLLNPADYPHIGFGHCSFDALRRPVTLDVNGNIRLCNHSPVVAGNIYESNLDEILQGEYAQSWQRTVPAFCRSCHHWSLCKGGCRAASEQCYGTLDEDPIVGWLL